MPDYQGNRPFAELMMPLPGDKQQSGSRDDEEPSKKIEKIRKEHRRSEDDYCGTGSQSQRLFGVVRTRGAGKGLEKALGEHWFDSNHC